MPLVDRCIFQAVAGGLGDFVVFHAVAGYLTPAQAGAVDQALYPYAAEVRDTGGNITAWETGRGKWVAASLTLQRVSVEFSSAANAKVSFAAAPVVALTVLAADLAPLTVNVKQFGAVGDGVTDDSAAILAAINACMINPAGSLAPDYTVTARTLHFPAGNYLVTVNNVFGQWTPATHILWTITGESWLNTRITFKPAVVAGVKDYFLHDGLSPTPVITYTTSAPTAAGSTFGTNNILTFASTAGYTLTNGLLVVDVEHPTAIPPGATIYTSTSTTIQLTGFVTGPGVSTGDHIQIYGNSIPQGLASLHVEGLQFRLNGANLAAPQTVGWFRSSTWNVQGYPESGWTFLSCSFFGDLNNLPLNGDILSMVGDTNSDTMHFIDCGGIWWRHVINCNNSGSTALIVDDSDWSIGTGDAYLFYKGNGLTVHGGSCIIDDNGRVTFWVTGTVYAASSDIWYDGRHYHTTAGGTSGSTPPTWTSGSASDGGVTWAFVADESMYVLRFSSLPQAGCEGFFDFQGMKVELRTCRAKIVGGGDNNLTVNVNFYGCDFIAAVNGFRTTIQMGVSGAQIAFDGCLLQKVFDAEPIVISFGGLNTFVYYYNSVLVTLRHCIVSSGIYSLVTWADQYAVGQLHIENCQAYLPGSYTTSPDILINGDMFNPVGLPGGISQHGPERKLKTRMVAFLLWPDSSGNPTGAYSSFTMPPNSILKRAWVSRTSAGGTGTQTFQIKNVGGTITYCTFPAITWPNWNVGVDNIMAIVPANDRTLMLTQSTSVTIGGGSNTPSGPGDYLMVEYY